MRLVGLTLTAEPGQTEPIKAAEHKISCPVCGKEYKADSSMQNHLREKHPEYVHPAKE